MKDSMIQAMIKMMPFMTPLMWVGVAIAAIGIFLVIAKFVFKSKPHKSITWSFRFVFAISIFFILAQIAGYFLSMPPSINFGDSSKLEFILVSFWQISLVFFVAALIIKFLGSAKQTQTV